MLFVTVGIVILVVSFVLALISLVREQKSISSKPYEPSVQPQTPDTNIEEPATTANQVLKPTGDRPVSQVPGETNATKSDAISRLEEQIEKAKTTEQAPSAKPEEVKQNTDEFWNQMMSDKEEEVDVPREPFPWEKSADAGPVQTQASQTGSQTDLPDDQSREQASGGVIHMSDLIKKP